MPAPETARSATGAPEPIGWEDDVTGLEGPDFWRRILLAELSRAARYKRSLTIVLIEVDGLREINRDWGTEVVRRALREVGSSLRRMSRTSDHCARVGVTRFGVVLTETDEVAAINFVERVREATPRSLPKAATGLRVGFGWASPRPGESAENLERRAERRLVADLETAEPLGPEPAADPARPATNAAEPATALAQSTVIGPDATRTLD